MKIFTKMSLVVLSATILVLPGCGGDEAVKPAPAAEPPTKSIVPPPPPEPMAQPAMVEPVDVDPLSDPNNILSQRIIYFDYDSYSIPTDSIELIRAHADYLSQNNSRIFTLEGHADERGSREYNIALGERRADAVRRILLTNGVADSQIQVISYGEERPAQLGHMDEAWSANRRAVFSY